MVYSFCLFYWNALRYTYRERKDKVSAQLAFEIAAMTVVVVLVIKDGITGER